MASCTGKSGDEKQVAKPKSTVQTAPYDIESEPGHWDPSYLEGIKNACRTGNEKSYNEAAVMFFLTHHVEELFYYSYIFAIKYNSGEAYYNLYRTCLYSHRDSSVLFVGTNVSILEHPEEPMNLKAVLLLLKAVELHHEEARHDAKELFGRRIPTCREFIKKNQMQDLP